MVIGGYTMVRGITGFNPTNKMNAFLQKSKGKLSNASKHIDLPSKIALGSLGAFSIANSIKEPEQTDRFVMSCSDYDGGGSEDCWADYACPITYP